jgi:hypothetical protein
VIGVSRPELVNAFLEGQISRRTLIRRLIAGGVSTGAAISYAQLLKPEHAGAAVTAAPSDHYPMVDMHVISSSLTTVRNNGRIVVRVLCTEELANSSFLVFLKTANGGIPIGNRFVPSVLTAAGTRDLAITIDAAALGARTKARFYVQMRGEDAERFGTLASAAKTLS